MRKNPVILRFLALFTMLVFVQKAGAGLFIHHLLHETGLPGKSNEKINYSCSCVDDFMMPFVSADEIPAFDIITDFTVRDFFFQTDIPAVAVSFSFLRGPPAIS